MAKSDRQQVNVDFTKFPQLLQDLDDMVEQDGPETDRSKFMRALVRQERDRRAQLPLPLPHPTNKQKKSAAESVVA